MKTGGMITGLVFLIVGGITATWWLYFLGIVVMIVGFLAGKNHTKRVHKGRVYDSEEEYPYF